MIGKKQKAFLYSVASEFVNPKKIIEIQEINTGHVNDTYLVIMPESEYILQRINTNVFSSPFGMMHNIKEVTYFLRKKVIYEDNNPSRAVLNIVKTKYNQDLAIKKDKYYRMLEFVSNSMSFDIIPSKELFSEMGRAVGNFQKLIQGFPPHVLDETIQHFHDTPFRYKQLLMSIKINHQNRKEEVKKEIYFFEKNEKLYSIITKKLKNKSIPSRVTHNDTKPSNVLFDKNTSKALCMIDLDTVMKGSIVYDYGDALRVGASNAREDEKNLEKVTINLDYFKAFTLAFLKEVKDVITASEVELLFYGYLIMTIEVAMRFLTDYLNGDIYFKINYDKHNLVRARNQIKVCEEIISKENEIKKIIDDCLLELEYSKKYFQGSFKL
ncbi:aminoglycoside phosphotransferase [Coprobacillus sp. CAG:698]|nr:aminoglycoside phosphotransferase [Coprobacillus sp. CAG:698]